MSVTVFIQGRSGVTRWQLGKRWLLLPVLLLASGSGLYQFHSAKFAHQQASVENERLARENQKLEVVKLKDATEAQLATLTAYVARMQAKMTRLEALGQQVAQNYQLEDQFDFSAEAGVGGPSDIGSSIEIGQLISDMDKLASRIDHNDAQLVLLETVAANLHMDNERFVSGRPVSKGYLSSPYGIRNDPFTGRRTTHKGVDFAGREGADVIATATGVVTWAGDMFGYGQLVEIDHGNGLRTRYGHNKAVSVTVGDVVAKGDKIASMGSSGRSTGVHVHYEVLRDGQQVDPYKFINRKAG